MESEFAIPLTANDLTNLPIIVQLLSHVWILCDPQYKEEERAAKRNIFGFQLKCRGHVKEPEFSEFENKSTSQS